MRTLWERFKTWLKGSEPYQDEGWEWQDDPYLQADDVDYDDDYCGCPYCTGEGEENTG